jgi:hypothetical protein
VRVAISVEPMQPIVAVSPLVLPDRMGHTIVVALASAGMAE